MNESLFRAITRLGISPALRTLSVRHASSSYLPVKLSSTNLKIPVRQSMNFGRTHARFIVDPMSRVAAQEALPVGPGFPSRQSSSSTVLQFD
nr:hypothetical protein [uncultured Noviherbaspirillum sp.]